MVVVGEVHIMIMAHCLEVESEEIISTMYTVLSIELVVVEVVD
jgi:hypothetical protein